MWLKAYGAVDRFALHTSTFGGGSLACTAGLATLRVLREENLLERCRARSERLLAGLRKLVERYKCDPLEEVRGEGLLIGLEFSPLLPSIAAHYKASDQSGMLKYIMRDFDGMIDTVPTLYALQSLLNVYGIYAQVARSNPFVLRIQPPLTIEDQEIDQLLAALETIAPDLADCALMVDTIVSRSTLGIHESADRQTVRRRIPTPAGGTLIETAALLKLPDEPVQQFCALFERHRGRVVVQRHGHRAGVRRHAKGGCRERSNRRIEFDGANHRRFPMCGRTTPRLLATQVAWQRSVGRNRCSEPNSHLQGGKDLHEDHAEPQPLHGGQLPMQDPEHAPRDRSSGRFAGRD